MTAAPNPLVTSAQNCDLRVAAQAAGDVLTLAYEFRNRSDRAAFLFNVVHRTGPSGGPEADPGLIYAEQAGAVLVLSKKIIPVPDNVLVEKPDVPYVTRVDPGGVFREKLSLPLPVKLFSPYRRRTPVTPGEMPAYFELGFFLAPDPSVAKPAGGHLVVYPFPIEKQIVLRAGPLGRFPVDGGGGQ